MNFKVATKSLITVILLSIGLIACDNTPDYSGVYDKTGNNGKIEHFSFEKISGNEYKLTYYSGNYKDSYGTVEVKNNSVFNTFDKSYKGKFEGDAFIFADTDVYKKSK